MAARRRVPRALLGGPFTVAQARAAGVGRDLLRSEGFRRMSEHVYVAADVRLDHGMLCRAACLEVPRGVISHPSAALAYRLPLGSLEPGPARPHLSTRVALASSMAAICVNHLEPVPRAHVVETAWGPTTSPARTFVDRAVWLQLPDLVTLGRAMLRRRLVTVEELADLVAWAHGRRGVARAREALRQLG